MENHLSLIGVAVSRSTRCFVQNAVETETLLLHLGTENSEHNDTYMQTAFLTSVATNLPHMESYSMIVLVIGVLGSLQWCLRASFCFPPFSML